MFLYANKSQCNNISVVVRGTWATEWRERQTERERDNLPPPPMHLSANLRDCCSSPESTCASKGEGTERHGKTHTTTCTLPEYKHTSRDKWKKKKTHHRCSHTQTQAPTHREKSDVVSYSQFSVWKSGTNCSSLSGTWAKDTSRKEEREWLSLMLMDNTALIRALYSPIPSSGKQSPGILGRPIPALFAFAVG